MVSTKRDIATKASTPLATTERMAVFAHLDADDFSMPCLHLNQGSGRERQRYGEFPAGAWIHTLTKADMTGETFAYVMCTSERVAWWRMDHPTQEGIHSRYPKGALISADVLSNPDLNVVDTLTLYVLLDGESVPFVIRAKKTSLAPVKAINTLERGRAAAGQAAGLYKLESDDRTKDGFAWKIPMFVPAGDADKVTMEKVVTCQQMLLTTAVRIADDDGVTAHVPPGKPQPESERMADAVLAKAKPADVDEASIPF